MGIALVVLLAYSVLYGGQGMAKEGAARWGGVASKVRAQGSLPARAGVGAVSGAGWMARSFGSGITSAAKRDWADAKRFFSPEGRKERAEAAAHREARKRERAVEKEQARFRKEAKKKRLAAERGQESTEPLVAGDPNAVPAGQFKRGDTIDLPDGNGGTSRWYRTDDGHQRGPWRNADGMRATDKEIHDGIARAKAAAAEQAKKPAPTAPQATPEAAPAAKTQGETMTATPNAPTGEAQDFHSMLAELQAMATTLGQVAAAMASQAEAAERLHGTATAKGLDTATLGQISALTSNALQAADLAAGSRSIAAVAAQTLMTKQGGMQDAYDATPEAADQSFFRGNKS